VPPTVTPLQTAVGFAIVSTDLGLIHSSRSDQLTISSLTHIRVVPAFGVR